MKKIVMAVLTLSFMATNLWAYEKDAAVELPRMGFVTTIGDEKHVSPVTSDFWLDGKVLTYEVLKAKRKLSASIFCTYPGGDETQLKHLRELGIKPCPNEDVDDEAMTGVAEAAGAMVRK